MQDMDLLVVPMVARVVVEEMGEMEGVETVLVEHPVLALLLLR
jgi:hypothetical protein